MIIDTGKQPEVGESDRERFITQLVSSGFVTPQLGWDWEEPTEEERQNPLEAKRKVWKLLHDLYDEELLLWARLFGEDPNFPDQKSWLKSEFDSPSQPVFSFLNEDGVDEYKTLLVGSSPIEEKDYHFHRCLYRSRERLEDIDDSYLSRFLVLALRDAHPTVSVHHTVESLNEVSRNRLIRDGWVRRVGVRTHKVYPPEKPTKANIRYCLSPKLWEKRGDLLWSVFHLFQCRGVKSLEFDRESLFKTFQSQWRKKTSSS